MVDLREENSPHRFHGSHTPRIGMLMLNTRFTRLPGDIGHPDTFDFPVERLVVEAANSQNVVESPQEFLVEPFVAAAQELERRGVRGIATSCGFLFRFQNQLARSVSIPVLSSSLLLIPFVQQMIGDKTIGILSAKASSLSKDLAVLQGSAQQDSVLSGSAQQGSVLRGYALQGSALQGHERCKYVIEGMEGTAFYQVYVENAGEPSVELFEQELVAALDRLKEKSEGRLGAIILECTNMPPFSNPLKHQAGVPVFDCCDLVRLLYTSVSYKKEGL